MIYKIGVTGVGGGVGQSIIKSLQGTNYQLVAMDGDLLGAGLYAVQSSYVIPYAKDPNYVSSLLQICLKEQIVALFPGLDAELEVLSQSRTIFEENGIRLIVSSPEVVTISDNKLEMYRVLNGMQVNVPYTECLSLANDTKFSFPVIVKQKLGGARSHNVFKINSSVELMEFKKRFYAKLDSYIIQEYIDGDEYTCGSVNLDGKCKGVIVMRRILRDGDTYKAFSVRDSVIENFVIDVVEKIKPFGACNIQLRLKDKVPYVFEINARCSGTTASRTLCGFNEPKMILDNLLMGINPEFSVVERTILRYWKELVVDNATVEKMKTDKFISVNDFKKL